MDSPETEQARWFAEEVQPHESALRAYLRGRFPALDADDLVQESYLKLLRARETGRIDSARAYLFRIARNAALGIFRQRRARGEVYVNDLEDPDVLRSAADVVADVNASQELALVTEAIEDLPARCRQVVMLRTLRGMSHREIACHLGISEQTVRVQVMRGMQKCTRFLRERGVIGRPDGAD